MSAAAPPLWLQPIDFTKDLQLLPPPKFADKEPTWEEARTDVPYAVFNPSCLIEDPITGDGLVSARAFVRPRSVNVRSWDGLNQIVSSRVQVTISKNSSGERVFFRLQGGPHWTLTHHDVAGRGGEDPRLFKSASSGNFCLYNDISEGNDHKSRKMQCVRLNGPHSVADSQRPLCHHSGIEGCQKNWSPFMIPDYETGHADSRDFLICDMCPLKIFNVQLNRGTIQQVCPGPALSDAALHRLQDAGKEINLHFRGGSGGIMLPGCKGGRREILFVGHTCYNADALSLRDPKFYPKGVFKPYTHDDPSWHNDYGRYYFAFFYTLLYTPSGSSGYGSFSIHRVSPMFQPPNRSHDHAKIIFPCGLSFVDQGACILMVYGEGDVLCRGMCVPTDKVLDTLIKTKILASSTEHDHHFLRPDPDYLRKKLATVTPRTSTFPPSLEALYGQIDAQIAERGHIDAKTGEGKETRTLLMDYATRGDLAAVKYLMEQGARLDVEDTYYGEGNTGRTAIIFPAFFGHADVVEYFASHALAERHITEARKWADGCAYDVSENPELHRRIIAALDRMLHGQIDAQIAAPSPAPALDPKVLAAGPCARQLKPRFTYFCRRKLSPASQPKTT
jgi:hypothetical protein